MSDKDRLRKKGRKAIREAFIFDVLFFAFILVFFFLFLSNLNAGVWLWAGVSGLAFFWVSFEYLTDYALQTQRIREIGREFLEDADELE